MAGIHPASFLGDSKGAEKRSHPSHSIPLLLQACCGRLQGPWCCWPRSSVGLSIKGAYLRPLPSQHASALTFGIWHLWLL